jgi:long-chain acyl-CoA synthetase
MSWPNVTTYLKQKVARFSASKLLTQYETNVSYTYAEFDALSDGLATDFTRLGISKGDRIAFLHPNHIDLLIGCFAAIKAGGVAVPLNPTYTATEIEVILKDCGAKILVSTEQFKEQLSGIKTNCPAVEKIIQKKEAAFLSEVVADLAGSAQTVTLPICKPDDLAMLFYTSGTTGKPKGVMVDHRNITFCAGNMAQNYGLTAADVSVICLPLNHIFANASPFWGAIGSGGAAVVMEKFQTETVFDAIAHNRVTWFAGVPTMFNYLIAAFDERPRDVSSLRMGLSGAASLSVAHLNAFEEKFGASLMEVYGLTESAGLVTANPVFGVRKPGSIGICVSGVSVRLVNDKGNGVPLGEVGELIFKGPNATKGYWKLPEVTAEKIKDGWVATADLAYQDSEGYFYIAGRSSELIISGGYNIFPREIEEVLYSHQDVGEAAVIGVANSALGEVPKAFVATKPGKSLNSQILERFCRKQLAKYKVPKAFEIMKELPKNATGKILKTNLS